MGYKGTLRSINSTLNKIDREAKRRQRELEKRQKEYEKMQALEQAAYDVEVFENYVERIQSIHKDTSEEIDWNKINSSPPPDKPIKENSFEEKARKKLSEYKPTLFHKIFKTIEKIKCALEKEIEYGCSKDIDIYESSLVEYDSDYSEWKKQKEISEKLLKGDPETIIKAIKEYGEFGEIKDLGSSLTFDISKEGILIVGINVHSKDIVPEDKKSLLKSGKLSIKKMPKGEYNEIFQDYVCSSAIRIAREVFSLLPVDKVLINSKDKILNKKTGHLENQIVLSVLIPRNTIETINLNKIDPSDSMENFIHNMKFKKTTGFIPVDEVNLNKNRLSG